MSRRLLAVILLALLLLAVPAQAQDIQSTLEDIVAEFSTPDGPALTVQFTNAEGSWSAAGGLADDQRPTEPGDRFRIGSMSKTFVAAAALLLVEEGLVELDAPAADWLPDEVVDNIANADTVTLRELLSMRSGIPDYLETDDFWNAVDDDPNHEWTAEEALEYAYGLPALFTPGEDFYYSNSNYLLAQLVLESAAGVPLHELLRELILDPLDLRDTYTQVFESLPGGFVFGYEDWDGDDELDEVSDINDGAGLADGGLVSTTADVTTFYTALLQEQTLLRDDSLDALSNFLPEEEGSYGLGLGLWETDWGDAVGHSGAVVGFASIGIYLPEYATIIVVLSASFEVDPAEVAVAIGAALLD